MSKIALLGKGLNFDGWKKISDLLGRKGIDFEIFQNHREISDEFTLGILLGYSRIVPQNILNLPENGFVLFHSSDLPEGRGWAPIYNTIVKGKDLTQTMLYASEKVDLGNILVKATYELEGNEVEEEVKGYDDLITLELLENFIEEIIRKKPLGKPQDESESTWWDKRYPKDSEINDLDSRLIDLINYLRGVPESAPTFFYFKGRKFYLKLIPEEVNGENTFDVSKLKLVSYI